MWHRDFEGVGTGVAGSILRSADRCERLKVQSQVAHVCKQYEAYWNYV